MVEKSEQTPRLDPLTPQAARAEYVRQLKALVEAGDYSISAEEIAGAVLAELQDNRHSE